MLAHAVEINAGIYAIAASADPTNLAGIYLIGLRAGFWNGFRCGELWSDAGFLGNWRLRCFRGMWRGAIGSGGLLAQHFVEQIAFGVGDPAFEVELTNVLCESLPKRPVILWFGVLARRLWTGGFWFFGGA